MDETKDATRFLREIDALNNSDKLYLLSHIANMLVKPQIKTSCNLTNLRGLGKELWEKNDIDDYISIERDSWN